VTIRRGMALCCLLVLCANRGRAQEPSAPQPVAAAQLRTAIDKLGDLDYATRTAAARTLRRAPAAQAVPALLQAVAEHADGYVRYRALVLLTGFNDPRTKDAMRESLKSPNDRLRAAGYSFFERNRDRSLAPDFLVALDKEAPRSRARRRRAGAR
jgi:HEAT repeat protein